MSDMYGGCPELWGSMRNEICEFPCHDSRSQLMPFSSLDCSRQAAGFFSVFSPRSGIEGPNSQSGLPAGMVQMDRLPS
jgi:hypothetical protein